MNTDYYIYIDENGRLLGKDKDMSKLAKDVSELLYPEEPSNQIIPLWVEVVNDSIYITGKKVYDVSKTDLYEIIYDCGFNANYIETEFVGNGEYRAIFHK